MEITYTLTEDDYIKFNLYHTKQSETVQKNLFIQRIIGPILFIMFAIIFGLFSNLSLIGLLITFSILSVLWYFFYPAYFYNLITRNVEKTIREGNNDTVLGQQQLIFKEDELVNLTLFGKTAVKWQGITELKEDEDYFYLYNSAVSAYIIPKRALRASDDVKVFLHEKIN